MRHIAYFILLLTVAVLCGCDRHRAFSDSLDRADSLLRTNPDSAFSILQSMEKDAAGVSKPLRMRHLLLWAQSRNKTFRPLPSHDTLQTLTDYYDSDGNQRMMALYMMGSLYRDSGNVDKALQYFSDAAVTADTTDSSCDFFTLSRIYSQISELFHRQKAPLFELEYNKMAERMAWKAKDTLGAVTEVDLRSCVYQMLNDTDSVYLICKRAERIYRRMGRDKEAAQTMPSLIDIYLSRDSLPQAKAAIDRFESGSGFFRRNGEIRRGSENYYGLLGRYYFQTGRTDSAMYFYRKMLRYPDKIDNLKDGYNGLVDIYRRQGNADSLAKYTRLAAIIADSIKKIYSPEDFTLSHTNYYAKRSNEIAANRRADWLLFGWGSLAAILFLLGVGYAIYRYFKRKRSIWQKEIDSERRRGRRSEERYARAKTDYESAMNKYDCDLKAKTQEISELEKTIYTIQKNREQQDDNNALSSDSTDSMQLQLKALITKLSKDSCRGTAAAREDLLTLRHLTSVCAPEFFNYISSAQYDLADRDILVCILIRYEFKPADISVVLNITPQLTSNIRTRINKKLFGISGTRHLDDNIKDLYMHGV